MLKDAFHDIIVSVTAKIIKQFIAYIWEKIEDML